MAATPKGIQKIKLDWNLERSVYDEFTKACSHKGYAPQVVVERLMKRYVETGQM